MMLRSVSKAFQGVCWTLLVASLGTMSVAVFLQVLLRSAFSRTWLQIEDIVVYAFSISIFSGMALAFRAREHLAITFFAEMLPTRRRWIVEAIADGVTIAFMVFLLVYGVTFAGNGMRQFSPLLRIPLGFIYVIVPFSALASILFIIERQFDLWSSNREARAAASRGNE
jgi:TRAP-type transport system small permease protein